MAGDKVVAVDLGGTNLRVALVDGENILKYVKVATPKTKNELNAALLEAISRVIVPGVKGIGIGSPGPLKQGVILNPPNLPWKNFNLQQFLEKKFKTRVVVENDAACVALAEAHFGVRKKDFVILTLGTGVGGGIIIDGKLYRGRGNAGELGHMILDRGKDLETYWQNYRAMSQRFFKCVLTVKELCELRDKRAKHILSFVTTHLAQGIANIVNAFDPEVVVLMGGARESGTTFLRLLQKDVRRFSIIKEKTPIVWSKLKHPGLLGASLLVAPKARRRRKQ